MLPVATVATATPHELNPRVRNAPGPAGRGGSGRAARYQEPNPTVA
jgi:hypothetical protein